MANAKDLVDMIATEVSEEIAGENARRRIASAPTDAPDAALREAVYREVICKSVDGTGIHRRLNQNLLTDHIVRFVSEQRRAATEAEREACAVIAEQPMTMHLSGDQTCEVDAPANVIAKRIRARSAQHQAPHTGEKRHGLRRFDDAFPEQRIGEKDRRQKRDLWAEDPLCEVNQRTGLADRRSPKEQL